MKQLLAALALTAVAPLAGAADTLDKVRETLRQLSATTPIRASVDLQVSRQVKGQPAEEGRAALTVTGGADGVAVEYAASTLKQAEAERPDLEQPVTDALSSRNAVEIASMIDGARTLLIELQGARLAKETATTLDGAAATLLDIELAVHVPKDVKAHLKKASGAMKLWVAADGTPLASDTQQLIRVGILFMGIDIKIFRTQAFARKGDRLVKLREHDRDEGLGTGDTTIERTSALKVL